jgi:hypothetical protein
VHSAGHREKSSKKQEGRRGKENAGKGEGKDKRQEAGERGRGKNRVKMARGGRCCRGRRKSTG